MDDPAECVSARIEETGDEQAPFLVVLERADGCIVPLACRTLHDAELLVRECGPGDEGGVAFDPGERRTLH